jgi:pimeloyl-ACP methyl ester carboxylesterase
MRITVASVRRLSLIGVLAIACAAGAAPSAVAAGPAVPSIKWQGCGSDYPVAQCATVKVPLDYDKPSGAKTRLALARIPATAKRKLGSVFINPGGPGGSGVSFAIDGFGEFLHENLGGRFDVVGFDPRGIGGSDPIHCFDSEDDLFAFLDAVPQFPYERSQFLPFYVHYASLASRCLSRDRTIAEHMSTADVVRDLDLLRQAVGDRRITFLGFSYGSYIGATYANLFPNNIRALAIDGVLDPSLWSSGWQIKSDRVATQEEFDEFLRLCRQAGPACAFGDGKNTAKRWETLARTVERQPVDLGDGFLYTYDFLIGDATGAMYSPEVWGGPEGYGVFLDLVADAALGDQSAKQRALAARRQLVRRVEALREADYDNGIDGYFGNQCADTEYPGTFSGFKAVGDYARAGSRFGPYWWWFNNGCTHWPTAADRYGGPWTTRTSKPVLVVGNFFDGVTAYTGAQAVNRQISTSRLLSYAGWGHTAYGRSDCTTAHVDAYLLEGTLPRAGTVCRANPNPFLTPAPTLAAQEEPVAGAPPAWLLRPEP